MDLKKLSGYITNTETGEVYREIFNFVINDDELLEKIIGDYCEYLTLSLLNFRKNVNNEIDTGEE